MRLMVTRPEPDAERTAAALRDRGHTVLVAALLEIEPIRATIATRPWAAVLMTSASAARAIARHPNGPALKSRPVFVVGVRTAEAARAAGFLDVTSAQGDVSDLGRLVEARFAGSGAPLLYLSGEETSGDLAGAVARAGLDVERVSIYQARAAQRFPAPADAALRHAAIDGVLHYSRRTAQSYLTCAEALGDDCVRALWPTHYCLSAQVAAPLVSAGRARVCIAPRPDEAALIDLIED
jgi:uroporphyrinogen-III synthase